MTEMLPSARTYPFTLGTRLLDVTIGYVGWPEIIVVIAERGHGQVLEARFAENGSLYQLTFRSAGAGEITSADLRRPAVIRTMQTWEKRGREAGRRILAGEREPGPGADGPAEALRMLAHGTPRKPAIRRRGAEAEQLVRDVAAAYRQAVAAGDPAPRKTIAAQLHCSVSHVGRLLMQARRSSEPLLGPAVRGKAGETRTETQNVA